METLPHFIGNERNCIARGIPPELTISVVVEKDFCDRSKIGTKLDLICDFLGFRFRLPL